MTSLEQRPSLEDRIRAATRAAASTVPDDGAPPLQLRAQQRRTNWRSAGFRHLWTTPRIWPGGPWMLRLAAPLAATAAVAVVIAASVAVTDRSHSAAPSASGLAGVPRYYLELTAAARAITTVSPASTGSGSTSRTCGPGHPASNCSQVEAFLGQRAIIRDTLTGATLATIHPPSPFDNVVTAAAAADDRTFVLAAQNVSGSSPFPCGPTRLFFARFNPADGHVALTSLPVREFPATSGVTGIALSPDGTRLAVALEPTLCESHGARRDEISVYALPSGAVMTSQFPPWLTDSLNSMSWAADGTLAVTSGVMGSGFHLLNTNTRSGNRTALTDPRMWRGIALKPPTGWGVEAVPGLIALNAGNGLITPDGKALVAPIQRTLQHPRGTGAAFGEFSASTGDLIQVLPPDEVLHPAGLVLRYSVVWTNSSGSVLVVVAGPATGHPAGMQAVYGVLRGHRFTSIPGAPAPADGLRLESNTTVVF